MRTHLFLVAGAVIDIPRYTTKSGQSRLKPALECPFSSCHILSLEFFLAFYSTDPAQSKLHLTLFRAPGTCIG